MLPYRPRANLQTHDVSNQPRPFVDVNLYDNDAALMGAVERQAGETHHAHLSQFGGRCGSAEVQEWADDANRNPPQLRSFDPLRPSPGRGEVSSRLPSPHGPWPFRRRRWRRLARGFVRPRAARGSVVSHGGRGRRRMLPDVDDLCGGAGLAP